MGGIVATRLLQRWYIRGGRWLFCARLLCGRRGWQELMSKRHELVLKAVRHGLVSVDAATPLTFAEPALVGRRRAQGTAGRHAWHTARSGGQCSLQVNLVVVSAATASGLVVMRHHPRAVHQK